MVLIACSQRVSGPSAALAIATTLLYTLNVTNGARQQTGKNVLMMHESLLANSRLPPLILGTARANDSCARSDYIHTLPWRLVESSQGYGYPVTILDQL